MTLKQFLRFLLNPKKFIQFYLLVREKRDRYKTLYKVTRLESAQDLHDKIRAIDTKLKEM